MAQPAWSGVLRFVRARVGLSRANGHSDVALLQRFAAQHDETALVTLLQRHGPLVLTTCRQVLRDHHAAEDAFQATFLVLARKAETLCRRGSLAPWLHQVAYRAALKVKLAATRRRAHEEKAMARSESTEASAAVDWLPILHEEVNRLPERFRQPVVLCYLQGRSYPEAAAELDWPLGTICSRISRARDLLQRRLVQRGVTLSAGALIVADSRGLAAVPPKLLQTTTRAALNCAAGGVLPATVAAITDGVLQEGFRPWLKFLLALMLVMGASVTAVVFQALGRQSAASDPEEQAAAPVAAEATRPLRRDVLGDPLPEDALARLGTLRFRHGTWPYCCLIFSADGQSIISRNGRIHRWDVATGKSVWTTDEGASSSRCAALSPDGRLLATAGYGSRTVIKLRDAATGNLLRELRGDTDRDTEDISSIAFSPDGKTLASVGWRGPLRLWDVNTGMEHWRMEQLGYTPCKVPSVGLWVTDVEPRIAFSPCGQTLIAAGSNGSPGVLRVRKVSSGEVVRDLKIGDKIESFAFAPDGKTLAVVCYRGEEGDRNWTSGLRLWDLDSGKEIRRQEENGSWINQIAFSPNGTYLAAHHYDPTAQACEIRLWGAATGQRVHSFRGRGGFAFSPDGQTLATTRDNVVLLHDVRTGREITPVVGHEDAIGSVTFSADSQRMATESHTTIHVWDATTGRSLSRSAAPAKRGDNWAYSPDGKTTVSVVNEYHSKNRSMVYLRDMQGGKEIRQFQFDGQVLLHFAFSADGTMVAAVDWIHHGNPGLWLWKTDTGEAIRLVQHPPGQGYDRVAFSPDGGLLALACRSTGLIYLWEIATGNVCREFRLGQVTALGFSGDGKTLAAAGAWPSPGIRLWEVATGKERRSLVQDGVSCLAFARDGMTLASGSNDSTALLWDATGQGGRARGGALSAAALASRWADLSGDDARAAYCSIGALAAVPAASVPFLHKELPPVMEPTAQHLTKLITDLDSPQFAVRQRAEAELADLAELAVAALEKALADRPPLETLQRLERLVDRVHRQDLPPNVLRAMRAVEVLEMTGVPEGEQLLRRLAGGAKGARLTREAKASLERLAQRSANK